MIRIYALIIIAFVAVVPSVAYCQTSYDDDHNGMVYIKTKNKHYSYLYDSNFMLFRSFDSVDELLNKKYYVKNSSGRPTAKPIVLYEKNIKNDEVVVVRYAEAKPRGENVSGAKTIKVARYKVGSDTPETSKTYYSVAELNSDNDWITERAYTSIFTVRNWLFENVAESKIYHDLTVNTEDGEKVYGQGFNITIVYTSQRYTPLPGRIRSQLLFF